MAPRPGLEGGGRGDRQLYSLHVKHNPLLNTTQPLSSHHPTSSKGQIYCAPPPLSDTTHKHDSNVATFEHKQAADCLSGVLFKRVLGNLLRIHLNGGFQ